MPSNDIEFLSPPGAIKPTGPWSLGVHAGDFVFVAGMRGIDPATNKLVEGEDSRGGGRRRIARCGAPCGLRHRHGPLPADREQNPGGVFGRRTLSATHHCRGEPSQSARHRRSGRNVLLSIQQSGLVPPELLAQLNLRPLQRLAP